jgi:hypothetical protein
VRVVGDDADLRAGVAAGFQTEILERHGKQGDGDLFAGGDQHIQFARVRFLLDFLGQGDQAIGFAGHRGQHDDHLMAEHLEFGDALRDIADAFDGTHRGAAVLLNN